MLSLAMRRQGWSQPSDPWVAPDPKHLTLEHHVTASTLTWSQCGPSRCWGLFRGVTNAICHYAIKNYNRTFPCIEANYPYAIKNLVLYGIRDTGVATLWSSRLMRAEPRWISTNESGPHCWSVKHPTWWQLAEYFGHNWFLITRQWEPSLNIKWPSCLPSVRQNHSNIFWLKIWFRVIGPCQKCFHYLWWTNNHNLLFVRMIS